MTDGNGITPRDTLSNAGWSAFVTIWNIVISFLLAPLLIHQLGTAQYGLLLLVWSATGLLSVTNLGVGEATLRFVSHYHADGDMRGLNRVFGATLSFYVLVCFVVSSLLFVAAPMVVRLIDIPAAQYSEAGWLLRLSALLFSVGMVSNAFGSVPMAMQRYDLSSKIGFGYTAIRNVGFIILAMSGFGVLHVITWDILVALAVLCLQVIVARALMPGIRCAPHASLQGLREIFGYGVYSFVTHIFLLLYRESGKLVLAMHGGPAAVAYLGTPDGVAYRIYMVVISAIETLMPRFSAIRDRDVAQGLVLNATRLAMTAALVLFIPLAALMPDLLRLWIGQEFAREGALAGQLLAISFLAPAGFAPIATFYRGTGRPGFVTAVMAAAGMAVLLSSLLWAPTYGAVGVGYGYLLSSVAWLFGLLWGWLRLFGKHSIRPFIHAIGMPLVLAVLSLMFQMTIREYFGEINWPQLMALGVAFSGLTCLLVFGTDLVFGDKSLSRQFVERFAQSTRVEAVRRLIQVWQTR